MYSKIFSLISFSNIRVAKIDISFLHYLFLAKDILRYNSFIYHNFNTKLRFSLA